MTKNNPVAANWLEINLAAIHHNINQVKRIVQVPIMAVLKANAYGLGIERISKEMYDAGVEWFAVARLSEAINLQHLPNAKILILGPLTDDELEKSVNLGFRVTVYSANCCKRLIKTPNKKTAIVHLKVETGFGRYGIMPDQLLTVAQELIKHGVNIEGLYSHFAMVDDIPNHPLTKKQQEVFKHSISLLAENFIFPTAIHFSNSAVAYGLSEAHYTMVRLGSAILGIKPFYFCPLPEGLIRCVHWKSYLASCKQFFTGTSIGYGAAYKTNETEWIGVVPVGYADGYRRSPENVVLIDGQRMPVVGRICCDALMVKLPREYSQGEEVVMLGDMGAEHIWVDELAQIWGTSQAEAISTITARVPRLYI
jgi:alanine racemase